MVETKEFYSSNFSGDSAIASSSTYISDIKSTIEFDRHCRSIESLLNNLMEQIEDVERSIS